MGCRSIAFIALGILSCIFTMAGTALPIVTLEEAQGSGSGGVFVYSEIDVKITLWKLCARAVGGVRCSAPATCTSSESVYDQCDTIDEGCLLSFIQAGRAFAILSCLAAFFGCLGGGAADIAGVLPAGRFVLAAIAGCLFIFELLAFCMFIGIWTTSCNGADSLSDTENTAWGPMPILFCLGMVLCVILVIVAMVSSDPQQDEAESGESQQQPRSAAESGHEPTVGQVVEPAAGPGVEGDWVWAGEWGLWWSATEALYLDHETGWYYEPHSRQWYQPDTGEWAFVSMERSLPSGPPHSEPAVPQKTRGAEEEPHAGDAAAAYPPPPAAAGADAEDGEDAHLAADPGDFVMDEGSGMYWSDSHAVYMDPQSSMRYCPNRERWYDPEARRWVHPE